MDPYELAVLGLHPNVTEKLLQIFRRGLISQHEVDVRVLEGLRDLPEASAVEILDKFASANLMEIRSKGGYLGSLIRKALEFHIREDTGLSGKRGTKRVVSDGGANPVRDGSLNVGIAPSLTSFSDDYRFTPQRGQGSLSAPSPQRHMAGMHENFVQSYSSNYSWGSFKRSPGSSSRGTPGKWGGRGFHRSNGSYSDSATPESYAKRSMLEDPWKDLVPVRNESLAFRLDSCSVPSSQDWLPKSISKVETSPLSKGVSVSASGPSLAESLAASFADAVEGEDFT